MRGLAVLLMMVFGGSLAQQLELRSELEFSSSFSFSQAFAAQGHWNLGFHLEARYELQPADARVVLDPKLRLASDVQGDLGLTEAYLRLRLETIDISTGIERLPLEVARLSVPYSIEAPNRFGQRQGLLGVRVHFNPQFTRVRLALLEDPLGWFAALSVRQEFGGFELEGHALAPRGRVVVGVGGSGTIEDLVLYGEGWGLFAPWETRYVLGISGNLPDGLWMLEGGYASPLAGTPAGHLLAGQVGWQPDQDSSWNLRGMVFFDSDALRGQGGLGYTVASDLAEWTFALGGLFGPVPVVLNLNLNIRLFL